MRTSLPLLIAQACSRATRESFTKGKKVTNEDQTKECHKDLGHTNILPETHEPETPKTHQHTTKECHKTQTKECHKDLERFFCLICLGLHRCCKHPLDVCGWELNQTQVHQGCRGPRVKVVTGGREREKMYMYMYLRTYVDTCYVLIFPSSPCKHIINFVLFKFYLMREVTQGYTCILLLI